MPPGKCAAANPLNLKRVAWSEGQPFTVQVPCGCRTTSSGRELSYTQFRLLVLRIAYLDGAVEFIPVEIPDGRVSRQVSVSLFECRPDAFYQPPGVKSPD